MQQEDKAAVRNKNDVLGLDTQQREEKTGKRNRPWCEIILGRESRKGGDAP